jgi:hypothetical protein
MMGASVVILKIDGGGVLTVKTVGHTQTTCHGYGIFTSPVALEGVKLVPR